MDLWARHLGSFVGLSLFGSLPALAGLFLPKPAEPPAFPLPRTPAEWGLTFLTFVANGLAAAVAIHFGLERLAGRMARVGRSARAVAARFVPLTAAGLAHALLPLLPWLPLGLGMELDVAWLFGLGIATGLPLSIILSIRLYLLLVAAVAEPGRGLGGACVRSWRLTSGAGAILLIVGLGFLAISLMLLGIFLVPAIAPAFAASPAGMAAALVVHLLVGSLFPVLATACYRDLRHWREGGGPADWLPSEEA